MKRDLGRLSSTQFDLVIIGGGIFGACAAWDAALRGLSIALVERGDFSQAASANCFKFIHGGLRYLQHGDLARVRESSRERQALLRIAPHLARPIPIAIPTYGHGRQSKALLRAALGVYDLLTMDRNRGLTDFGSRIPAGHFLSRAGCLAMFPGLHREGLTGAAVFHDAQIYSPARLVLAFLHSAAGEGAAIANYVEATGFRLDGNRVSGVYATDGPTGRSLEIRGRVVLNAAGPWAERLLARDLGLTLRRQLTFSRDAYFLVRRRLETDHALAVQARTKDPDALLSRGHRHLFLAPWRDYTLIGVWHTVYRDDPDRCTVTGRDLQGFLDEINAAYPSLGLAPDDVLLWGAGLVLFGDNAPGATHLSYGKRSVIIDHRAEHGLEGLISLIGVRYTTARGVAERAVNAVFKRLGRVPPPSMTAVTPVEGGRIERFDPYVQEAIAQRPESITPETMKALIRNHGTEHRAILRYLRAAPALARSLEGSTVLQAEVLHAVREEMAQKLADVVFRRTDLGTGGHPGEAALRTCAELMAAELGWDARRVQRELEEVEGAYPHRRVGDGEPADVRSPDATAHAV